MDYRHIEFLQHFYVNAILTSKNWDLHHVHKMTKYTNHIYFNNNI